MNEHAHAVLWRRLKYMLTPQWDIYVSLRDRFVNQVVLEVGFGTGAGVVQYAPKANNVTAIEIDPEAVQFAKETFPLWNVGWGYADITEYTAPEVFDAAVMVETLEHIPQWDVALRNIHTSLRPGGELVITARNKNADLRRWKDLHEREWTAQEFYDALDRFFGKVTLYDYSLTHEQNVGCTLTPLVGIATKQRPGYYVS